MAGVAVGGSAFPSYCEYLAFFFPSRPQQLHVAEPRSTRPSLRSRRTGRDGPAPQGGRQETCDLEGSRARSVCERARFCVAVLQCISLGLWMRACLCALVCTYTAAGGESRDARAHM